MIDLELAAKWIPLLGKELVDRRQKRRDEINKLAKELLFVPRELVPVFVEPDLQPYSPADEPNEEDDVFRTPFYGWMANFIRSKKDQNDGRRQLFILGDAGMGKTSVLAMFALAHIHSFFSKKYKCVTIKLGSDALWRIKDIPEKADTVLLLDSLDEDIETVGRIRARILELLEATEEFFRVVITCRTQFFPETEDLTFRRQDQVKIGPYKCPVKYLSLFSDAQVDEYLNKKYQGDRDHTEKAKDVSLRMNDLRCRPLLLTYIDDLIDHGNVSGAYGIYDLLVSAWLDRECRKRSIRLDKATLLDMCQRIAHYMMQHGKRTIDDEELRRIVHRPEDRESFNFVDVGGRSLLNKNSDGEFLFSHQSFPEFLVIQALRTRKDLPWEFPVCSEMMSLFMRTTDMRGADLGRANLVGAELRNARLDECVFNDAVLYNALLDQATLSSATLLNAILDGTKLEGANFSNSRINKCTAKNAKLANSDFSGARIEDCSLQGVLAIGAKFSATKIRKADFENAVLEKVDFSGSELADVRFPEASLANSMLSGARLLRVTFEKAVLKGADLRGLDLTSVNVEGADFTGANLKGCNLTGRSFKDALLNKADLTGANLTGVRFFAAPLTNAKLNDATLENANLENTSLEHVQMDHVDVSSAKLSVTDRRRLRERKVE